jgi:hypothetical protein
VGQSVLPLAIGVVNESYIIDGIGIWIFGAYRQLKAWTGLEGLQLFLNFGHIGMGLGDILNRCKISDELVLIIDALIANG